MNFFHGALVFSYFFCHPNLSEKNLFNSRTSICRGQESQSFISAFSQEVLLLLCGFMDTKNVWGSVTQVHEDMMGNRYP